MPNSTLASVSAEIHELAVDQMELLGPVVLQFACAKDQDPEVVAATVVNLVRPLVTLSQDVLGTTVEDLLRLVRRTAEELKQRLKAVQA